MAVRMLKLMDVNHSKCSWNFLTKGKDSSTAKRRYSSPSSYVQYIWHYGKDPQNSDVFQCANLKIEFIHAVSKVYGNKAIISDLSELISGLNQPNSFFLSTGWPFGSLVCKMSGMVQGISVSASVFTLVAIAVDRYFFFYYCYFN